MVISQFSNVGILRVCGTNALFEKVEDDGAFVKCARRIESIEHKRWDEAFRRDI